MGESTYDAGSTYEGADLMRLLNGYYIDKEEKTCTYCNGWKQETCSNICNLESLKSANMKVLTNTAKGMIENAVWDTYAVDSSSYPITISNVSDAYLQEKGISTQYTGKICKANDTYCNDSVIRTTSWTGLVGLMSVSDMGYANGWLYKQSDNSGYPWLISPFADSDKSDLVWYVSSGYAMYTAAFTVSNVFPTVYLKSDIEIIGGDGFDEPYKLK